MFCESCGTKNLHGSNFCECCGKKLINNVVRPTVMAYANPGTSYFDGKFLGLIGWYLVGIIVIICTLGIGFPIAIYIIYDWKVRHTVINGRRLGFDGKVTSLFKLYFKWVFFSIITLGIYLFWIPISLKKWKIKHTYFVN